jgi:hypothetical protein
MVPQWHCNDVCPNAAMLRLTSAMPQGMQGNCAQASLTGVIAVFLACTGPGVTNIVSPPSFERSQALWDWRSYPATTMRYKAASFHLRHWSIPGHCHEAEHCGVKMQSPLGKL